MRYVSKTWKKMIVRAPPLSAAGFAATTISFGPARMGFGLFVPEFRTAFSMSTSSVGLVSSIGFSGFLAGLLGAQALLRRWGPEAPVLLGLIAATIGMSVIAMAPSITVLAFGVFCASSSAGFTWTPFHDQHGNQRRHRTGGARGLGRIAVRVVLACVLGAFCRRQLWCADGQLVHAAEG